MDEFHEPEGWEDTGVHIEDLGAPDKGLGFWLFSLGEKWHAVSQSFQRRLSHGIPLGVLAFLLLSSSALLSPAAQPSFSAVPHQQVCYTVQVAPTGETLAETTWVVDTRLPLPPGNKTLTMCGMFLRSLGSQTPQPQR